MKQIREGPILPCLFHCRPIQYIACACLPCVQYYNFSQSLRCKIIAARAFISVSPLLYVLFIQRVRSLFCPLTFALASTFRHLWELLSELFLEIFYSIRFQVSARWIGKQSLKKKKSQIFILTEVWLHLKKPQFRHQTLAHKVFAVIQPKRFCYELP